MNNISTFVYIILPILSALIIPLVRSYFINLHSRLSTMETQIQTKTTEEEVRILLADKLEPVKESLAEIRDKIERLTSYLIDKK